MIQIAEGNNFVPGSNPFGLDAVGWIHEESSLFGRCCSQCAAGFREIKYVQHHGPPPASLMKENEDWCWCQTEKTPKNLTEEELNLNVVATHEKKQTCGVFCCWVPCVCDCFGLPYLETKDATGKVLGKTQYVCDMCCFVPKFDISDASGKKLYRLRPDTCVGGLCIMCRCDGDNGKCCRVPFILRDPDTLEPVLSGAALNGKPLSSMVDTLWSGWKNECCSQKNAYHVTFPKDISAEEKAILMGSTILVDVSIFEVNQDDNS